MACINIHFTSYNFCVYLRNPLILFYRRQLNSQLIQHISIDTICISIKGVTQVILRQVSTLHKIIADEVDILKCQSGHIAIDEITRELYVIYPKKFMIDCNFVRLVVQQSGVKPTQEQKQSDKTFIVSLKIYCRLRVKVVTMSNYDRRRCYRQCPSFRNVIFLTV